MASRVRGWVVGIAAAVLLVEVSAAQAPVVPTDHYGPPSCPGVTMSSHRNSVEAGKAEQELGAKTASALLAAEPVENLDFARDRVADYADCVGKEGCYWADLDAQFKRAEASLATQVAAAKAGERLAVVFDIDETSLSSYCESQREDFGYVGAMFNAWVVSPEAAVAIPGALRLFQEAKAAKVAVFFITGRPGVRAAGGPQMDQTKATAANLEAAGFHGWADLRVRNGAENGMATVEYKSAERRKIVEQGYRIVMNVGDQWSDLLGDPQAAVSVKLPNPFYFLPSRPN
jgi:hypothetical protein